MSGNMDSQFKKLEVEYARLLKSFSEFEKIKGKLASDGGDVWEGNRRGVCNESKPLNAHQVGIIAESAKKDLKALSTSLKKLEAHIKHGVNKV